jgi:hypothetical protein
MTGVTVLALLVGVASAAPAADLSSFQKAYFGSTKPGSWARYEQRSVDQKGRETASVQTVSRLENEGDRVWMEIRTEPRGGKAKASTLKYLMKQDFHIDKNALDFMKHIDRIISQEDGGEATELPLEMLKMMSANLTGNVDYGENVTAKGSEMVDGLTADRYAMAGKFAMKVVFTEIKGSWESDLWLNDSVPFGRVKESTTTKDEGGKLLARTDSRLLETGTGARTRITGPVKKSEMPKLPF